MITLNERWENFLKEIVEKNPQSTDNINNLKIAFFSGSASTLYAMKENRSINKPYKEVIKELDKEMQSFVDSGFGL